MSITSPLEVRTQLGSALGKAGLPYWNKLRDFLIGKLARTEFEELVRQWINTPELVHLHNSLIYAILAKASQPVTSLEGNQSPLNGPPRKKRKLLLPHQDSAPKLSKWVLGMGKQERDRVKSVSGRPPRPANFSIVEKPVRMIQEGSSRAGTHVALPLSGQTRTLPTLQQLSTRMDVIASQHQLTASKPAAALLAAALEAYLKQIIIHALAATSSSHPFTSITSSQPPARQPTLHNSAFSTLFSLAPFESPVPTAAVTQLLLAADEDDVEEEGDEDVVKYTRFLDPSNAQIVRTLMSFSGVRGMMKSKANQGAWM